MKLTGSLEVEKVNEVKIHCITIFDELVFEISFDTDLVLVVNADVLDKIQNAKIQYD
jgi:prophage DNA circulation protein